MAEEAAKNILQDREDLVEKEVMALRQKGASCSNATLVGLARVLPLSTPEETLAAVAAGLRGGIGGTRDEGTCGALVGAVIAAGLYYSEDEKSALKVSRELYERFKAHRGSTACGHLSPAGRMACNECCVFAARNAIKLL